MNLTLKTLAATVVLLPFTWVTSTTAQPLPLQPGVYYGGGSKYITIFQKNNRYCYNGLSKNGESYFSLEPVPKFPGRYKLSSEAKNKLNDTFIVQTSRDTIAFGILEDINNREANEYRFDGVYEEGAIQKNPYVKRCLSSRKPFVLIIPSNR